MGEHFDPLHWLQRAATLAEGAAALVEADPTPRNRGLLGELQTKHETARTRAREAMDEHRPADGKDGRIKKANACRNAVAAMGKLYNRIRDADGGQLGLFGGGDGA